MKMCKRLMAGLAVGLVSVVCGTAQAADMLVNDFGDGVQSWRFDFSSGAGSSTLSQDPTEGSPGNAAGALKLDMDFAVGTFAFTGDVFFPATDLSGFANLEFDLKIADGAAFDAFGNHGFMNFVSRETGSYTWNPLLSENLAPATGWTAYSLPASSLTASRAFTLQLYGEPSQNLNGNVTLFLDNIRLTGSAVPEPSSALIALMAIGGASLRRRQC